jgi:hypothetical protein
MHPTLDGSNWVKEYADIRRLARKDKLPAYMWDTRGGCEALFRFAAMVIVDHEKRRDGN